MVFCPFHKQQLLDETVGYAEGGDRVRILSGARITNPRRYHTFR
jgi:hypothetical protein